MIRLCIYIFIGYLMLANMAFGQSSIHEINAIKRNKSCIYAEATLPTEQEAAELAQELLVKYIEDYLKEDTLKGAYSNFVVKDIIGKREKLSMKRGEMVRVFLYVNKEDIIPAKNMMTLQKEEPKHTYEEDSHKSSKVIAKEEKTDVQPSPTTTRSVIIPINQPSVIMELLESSSAEDALETLARLKAEYKVKRYGSYGECKDITTVYWLILGEDNTLCAILDKGENERIDFITNTYTSLKAYSGKSAVWFTLSDN